MNRRHLLTVILMLTNVSAGLAQTAGMMSFQGYVKDGAGVPLSGPHDFLFEIIDTVSPTPNVLATFTQTGVQATQGVVSTKYGPVSPALFDGLTPGGATRRLRVTVTSLIPDLVLTPVDIVTPPAVAEQLNGIGSGAPALRTNSSGNIGIGAPPTSGDSMYVAGQTTMVAQSNSGLRVFGNPSGQTMRLHTFDWNPGTTGSDIRFEFDGTGNITSFLQAGISGGSLPGALSLNPGGGNVGIGTATPTARFHVEDSGSNQEIALFNGRGDVNDPHNAYVFIHNTLQAISWGFAARDDGSFSVHQSGGPGDRIHIEPNGNVGIGTSTPTARLCVNGSIAAVGSLGTCSDARFKTNIAPLGDALATLAKLRAVSFDWRCAEFPNRNFDDKPQIGFIAQEMLDVVPEVVQQGSDGYYSVDYGRLTPILTAAVQELHRKHEAEVARRDRQIADLTNESLVKDQKIAAANRRIDALTARLEKLEAALTANGEVRR